MASRAAIIGTGFMGWVHVEALRRAGVEPIGVLGSSAAKSKQAAEQYNTPRAYSDVDQLLSDPDVDAVHIATPNRLHFELCTRAISAGKHVLCEKPLTMNSVESQELVRLASDHPNQAAAVNYNIRYYPLCVELRERIRRGDLGRMFSISGGYVQDWLLKEEDYNWRVLSEEGGPLRAVSDIGTHWMDLITWICGERIEAVFADLQTVHPQRRRPLGEIATFSESHAEQPTEAIDIETEDAGNVLLRFASGARGVMHVSQVTAGRKNCLRLEIAGSEGSAAWNSEEANQLWLGSRNAANAQLIRDPALLSPVAQQFASYPGGHNEGYADSFKQSFRAFYQYIAEGRFDQPPEFPTFADGHREVKICEAILESNQAQTWVAVDGVESCN